MRSVVAVIMAVLGTILVLSGAAALWAMALVRARTAAAAGAGGTAGDVAATSTTTRTETTRTERTADAVSHLPGPERLIVWGVVLLALSGVASGAITLYAGAVAGTP